MNHPFVDSHLICFPTTLVALHRFRSAHEIKQSIIFDVNFTVSMIETTKTTRQLVFACVIVALHVVCNFTLIFYETHLLLSCAFINRLPSLLIVPAMLNRAKKQNKWQKYDISVVAIRTMINTLNTRTIASWLNKFILLSPYMYEGERDAQTLGECSKCFRSRLFCQVQV